MRIWDILRAYEAESFGRGEGRRALFPIRRVLRKETHLRRRGRDRSDKFIKEERRRRRRRIDLKSNAVIDDDLIPCIF